MRKPGNPRCRVFYHRVVTNRHVVTHKMWWYGLLVSQTADICIDIHKTYLIVVVALLQNTETTGCSGNVFISELVNWWKLRDWAVCWMVGVGFLESPEIFLFSAARGRALYLTRPPFQGVPAALSPGWSDQGLKLKHSSPSNGELKNDWRNTSTPYPPSRGDA
jgi:hypothetical protein